MNNYIDLIYTNNKSCNETHYYALELTRQTVKILVSKSTKFLTVFKDIFRETFLKLASRNQIFSGSRSYVPKTYCIVKKASNTSEE